MRITIKIIKNTQILYLYEGVKTMNKMIKKLGLCTILPIMMMNVVACSKQGESSGTSANSVKSKVDIKDIAWNIDAGIVDGERYVLMNYTNNSKYTIANFEITFKEKTDITEDEKNSFYTDIQKIFNANDEDTQRIKEEPIAMYAESDKVLNPKESVENIKSCYYHGYYNVKDMKHYELMEPDIAKIQYVDDNKIYTTYYDYSTKKYSNEATEEIAYEWSQTDLGNKIPKPEVVILENISDNETSFTFYAYGMTLDQYQAYIAQCKELGYTQEPHSYNENYSANNSEGYKINLDYNKEDCKMHVSINAPETKEE